MEKSLATRYTPKALSKHTRIIRQQCSTECGERRNSALNAISFLGYVFETTEQDPISLQRNVKLMLVGRFINHLYSQHLLIESGLLLDAQNAARSAVEATAWYWLVCIDPSSAELYDAENSPRPVEIRKKLEQAGIDVKDIHDAYRHFSHVSHVGNWSDQAQVDWNDQEKPRVLIGGGADASIQNRAFNAIVAMMVLFLKHDPTFEVIQPNN